MSTRVKRDFLMLIAAVATTLLSSGGFAAHALAADIGGAIDDGHPDPVQITFTKWVTVSPGGGIMEGIVGGDVHGTFVGQVIVGQLTSLVDKLGKPTDKTNVPGDVMVLQAVYEVHAGEHSLRALVSGGHDEATNHAYLDGRVLGGWHAGSNAHVEFINVPCAQSNAGSQPNAAGGLCFQGTITITPGSAT